MVSEGFYDYRDNKGHQCSLLGTTLGAFCVFFLKNELSKGMQKALTGFAAGVMVAASIWSLLLPALEQGASLGMWKFLPAVIGFWIGILFLMAIDYFAPPECIDEKCKNKLLLAVTLHNIPEGMAVGIVLAQAIQTGSIYAALALSIGIAIQNFPEGAILSLPLKSNGFSKHKAFLIGSLSGIVEPIFGFFTILFSNWILQCLPFCLSFAAGAMLFVVIEELVPEMAQGKHSNLPTISFLFGFCVMMVLDVILG